MAHLPSKITCDPVTDNNRVSADTTNNPVATCSNNLGPPSTIPTTQTPVSSKPVPSDVLLQFDPLSPPYTTPDRNSAPSDNLQPRAPGPSHQQQVLTNGLMGQSTNHDHDQDILEDIYSADTDPESSDNDDTGSGSNQNNASLPIMNEHHVTNNHVMPNGSDQMTSDVVRGRDEESGHVINDVIGGREEEEEDRDHECVICMNSMLEDQLPIKTLATCCHTFHTDCLDQWFSQSGPKCPSCMQFYGVPRGNQPDGRINFKNIHAKVPGFQDCEGAIEITYSFRSGIQGPNHPRPGKRFAGIRRTAYLPNNNEGQRVANLLRLAFECRVVFTIGDSVTTGAKDIVVFNGIHHKTVLRGSPYGYPDKGYLERLEQELAVVGITDDLTLTQIHQSQREHENQPVESGTT